MPMPACLAAARFRALARLADLVSRAYIHCMAEMAEDPRRSAERRRALELLAASPDGCTAAIRLAHGFKSDRLVELINARLASVTTERVIAGDRAMKVTRVRITDAPPTVMAVMARRLAKTQPWSSGKVNRAACQRWPGIPITLRQGALGPSCVSPTPHLKRDQSLWPEFGWIPGI